MKKLIGIISCVVTLGLCLSAVFIWNGKGGKADENAETPVVITPTSNTHWLEDSSFYKTTFEGDGSETNPYIISSAEELAGLAYNVNNGENYSDKYFKQTIDIDLGAHYWVPIGLQYVIDMGGNNLESNFDITNYINIQFRGNYDGNNKTVSHMFMPSLTKSDPNYCPSYPVHEAIYFGGLFGCVQYSTIENVNVADSFIPISNFAGSVAGLASESIFRNCSARSSVLATLSSEDFYGVVGMNVGGIVGGCDDYFTRIYNCSSSVVVASVLGCAGGIVGISVGDLELKNCENGGNIITELSFAGGGIIGCARSEEATVGQNKVKIHNCKNRGIILGSILSDDFCGGGIAGICDGDIYYCQNYGVVSYKNNADESSWISYSGDRSLGGIVGEASNIRSCLNNGAFDIDVNYESSKVNEVLTIGGIVARGFKPISNSTSSNSTRKITIRDSFNRVSISSAKNVAGIIAVNEGSKLYNCYNTGTLENRDNGTAQGIGGAETVNSFNIGQVTSPNGTAKAVSTDASTKCHYPANSNMSDSYASTYYSLESSAKSIGFYTASYNWSDISPWDSSVWKLSESENDGYPVQNYIPEPDSDEPMMKGVWEDVQDSNFEGEGTEESPYLIKTPEQLAGLAHYINTNQNINIENGQALYPYFALDNDIDMSGRYWSSIGGLGVGENNSGQLACFTGTFDGRGHTISGLKMQNGMLLKTEWADGGLFGVTYGATIKNVTLKNSQVFGGGIVNFLILTETVETQILNCHNYASVTSGNGQTMFGYSGGIVSAILDMGVEGELKDVLIEDCSNHGNIISLTGAMANNQYINAGGILGFYDVSSSNVNLPVVKINRCYNEGYIEGETAVGIAFAEDKVYLSNCYNKGTLKGLGVCGIAYAGTVINCFNMGEAIGEQVAVGLGGMQIYNSFNVGKLSATDIFAIAFDSSATVEKCYFSGDYNGGHANAVRLENLSTVAKTKEWFEDASNWFKLDGFVNWDFNNGWSIRKTINEGYPNLVMNNGWWVSEGNFTVAFEGNGSKENPYLIESEAQLAGLAVMVNDGVTYAGKYFLQTRNLDMSGLYWLSIGDMEYDVSFQGNFDGRGYKISGLTTCDSANMGLFGRAKNATFSNILIGENSSLLMSGIAGEAENTTFQNCSNYATVAKNEILEGHYAGGIVGKLTGKNSHIDGCSNFGKISGSYVGGIVGLVENNEETIIIQNCRNEGEIYGEELKVGSKSYNFVGGIVGFATTSEKATRGNKLIVDNCQNYGVVARNVDKYSHESSGFGGIVGGIEVSGEITNCQNYGDFKNSAGGILGYINDNNSTSEINKTYGVSIKIEKCKNFGNIGNQFASGYIGGIFQGNGRKIDLDIISCANFGDIISNSGYLGGISGGESYNSKRDLSSVKIMLSWNEGDITSDADPAGITASENDVVFACYNTGIITSRNNSCYGVGGLAKYCYNTGKLVNAGSGYQFYGVSNHASYSFNIGAMNDKGVHGTYLVGSGINNYYGGATLGAEEYKTDNESVRLDDIEILARTKEWYSNEEYWGSSYKQIFEYFWQIDPNVNDGLPTLKEDVNFDDYLWATEINSDINFEGDGSEQSPYIIETSEQLAGIVYLLKTSNLQEGLHFKQTADIDMSGKYWESFGAFKMEDSMPYLYFSGNYDGGNHTISGLENLAFEYLGGLFGATFNSKISNLNIIDSCFSGCYYSASFVGMSIGETVIENCRSSAKLDSEVASGGIGGAMMGNSTLKNCIFIGSAMSLGSYAGAMGGLVAGSIGSMEIDGCYAGGELSGNTITGGFVGILMDESNTTLIENSVSASKILTCDNATGGFVGQMQGGTIRNCLSAVNFELFDPSVDSTKIGGFVGKLANSGSSISNVIFNCANVSTTELQISAFACGDIVGVVDLNSCYSVTNEGKFYTDGLFEGWAIDENINNNLPIQIALFHGALNESTNVVEHLINKDFNLVA